MKKLFLIPILLFVLMLTSSLAYAQGMMGNWTGSPLLVTSNNHTAQEEVEGKEVWEKLQAKQLECKDLTNDNYTVLGEYFMGQSIGNTQRHAAMNQMMTSMIGKEGEEQMHVVMGKRMSGCDSSAQFPSQGVGLMPIAGMMQMMGMMAPLSRGSAGQEGGGSMMGYGGWSNMMSGWGGFGFLSILFWLFWLVVLVDLILLGMWLWKKINKEK
ncbi:hypothetical protein A3C98_04940 [Candidatus Roizmanbacteria bacterium RIFCSPHIGHO2_02_FULL_37_15]|uniref:Uncharacterized protein n=1 Tax=Candidatus Roizmanbacteria bacterium RIFCSPLOWO2_01_FULL_37_16 TaxID=1802058 RepID=A0A1F7IQP1_9BACT|nr:MAG: hypothetical protein A2859_00840 [Candidatus Roizmanbacteria bacterium RIFCSPHIGHO2_01_FULL_37_16b]OGK22418.1 MAG: hypothetical protein A3C98_04940 [Candidatus Roizmanbacteria bacterium RIFCSPHIGHO2_02_FULL_37_15]OGK32117.1 MAG: hypothetical protein A3F57_03540 [Candidatus Roizmanbacteria bacterium RIFCSPHIGHO2_12_FULL_36_11]OGK45686.1 MAG: hypothetical protein A3B40_04375 [Candidatus Roizmanbacteria bacterium RIFCSPLOWO2_01_FULL_37_16]